MVKHACELFDILLKEASLCETIPFFNHYKDMTTSYAEQQILKHMTSNKLYRYNDRLLIKYFGKLCIFSKVKSIHIQPLAELEETQISAIKVDLPFSIKHILPAYRPCDVKRVSDYFLFHQIICGLTDNSY